MVASSPPWWLIEVAVELSAKLLNDDSGTMVVKVVASALPLDGSRAAVIFVTVADVLDDVLDDVLAAVAGTYTERSASGLCA